MDVLKDSRWYTLLKDGGAKNAEDDPAVMAEVLWQLSRAPLSFIVSVLAVELTIHFNHIRAFIHFERQAS